MKRFAALLLLACAVTAQIDLSNKKLLFPLGTDGLNIESVTKKLPQYSLDRDAKVSDRCFTGTSCGSEYLVQSSFTQKLDTGLAITICLCNGHVMGAAEIARKFAHVPAALRSATNLISSKAPAADSSFSVNNAISLMGVNSVNTIVREAAHTFDTANGASNSGRYVTALRKDACVIDGEATLSASEAWSSSVLVWAYFLAAGDANKANDAAYKCWAEQKKAVEFFIPVETTNANFFTNEYEIVPTGSKDSALGVGKDMFTITTAANTKSKWHFIRASGRSFLICETVQHLCIDAYGRTRNGDSPIIFQRRNAGINQRWNLAENNGAWTFSNQANRLFLDIASCSRFSNSTNAVMAQESSGNNCQKWTLKEIPKPKPSTVPKTHSSSYSESTKKTESFSERPTTHTKTKTATVSTRGTDKVSSSRSVVNTVPHSQSFSIQIQPGRTISASKDVVPTGTTQQVYTGSMMANKTRTATESTKVSTFTKPSKTKSLSRTAGNSFSVSKTRTATN